MVEYQVLRFANLRPRKLPIRFAKGCRSIGVEPKHRFGRTEGAVPCVNVPGFMVTRNHDKAPAPCA